MSYEVGNVELSGAERNGNLTVSRLPVESTNEHLAVTAVRSRNSSSWTGMMGEIACDRLKGRVERK